MGSSEGGSHLRVSDPARGHGICAIPQHGNVFAAGLLDHELDSALESR
jgi:hypothetical protein